MILRRLYNIFTWLEHRLLNIPVRLKVAKDNKAKSPELTVIFLHGIAATSKTWQTVFNKFNKEKDLKSVRMIALDLLGFGKSLKADWLDYDYMEYGEALNQAFRHLKISTPVVLVGHSMGSLIAADYVVNQRPNVQISRLVLVSPPVLMAAELARLPDEVYARSYSSLHRFAEEVPAAEVIGKIVQRFSSFRSNYLKTAAFEKSMEQVILNHHNYQTFTKIRVPTLLIHGHFDPLVMGSNLRRIARHNSTYVRYASVIGHHDISVGKRVKILTEIKRALKDESQNKVI